MDITAKQLQDIARAAREQKIIQARQDEADKYIAIFTRALQDGDAQHKMGTPHTSLTTSTHQKPHYQMAPKHTGHSHIQQSQEDNPESSSIKDYGTQTTRTRPSTTTRRHHSHRHRQHTATTRIHTTHKVHTQTTSRWHTPPTLQAHQRLRHMAIKKRTG